MACGHGFLPVGTRRPRPELSGLWTDDAYLRSSLSPRPYLGRSGATDLQAQPLSRSGLSGSRQDQQPRTRNHHRSAPDGDRLGRLLLDRTSTLCAPHGDLLDSIRTPGRLPDQALRRCDRPVHPTLPGHARGAAARRRVTPPTLRVRGGDHPLHRRAPPAREGTRGPLCRAGVDPEARLVRRAVALGNGGRGPTPDQEGQGVGRVLGHACGALDVGSAGCVRHGDRGGIPRRAAPLL